MSTAYPDDRAEWYANREIEPSPMTAYDCEPDPLLDQPDARLRVDPWEPFTCQRCGDEDRNGMPKNCTCCGWENY